MVINAGTDVIDILITIINIRR